MRPEQQTAAWFFALGFVALIVYALIEARHTREKKRSARVLEHIELRMDKIEATMRALPQLLLEAYNQLEKRRGPGDRD
jgi:hypothetical protein